MAENHHPARTHMEIPPLRSDVAIDQPLEMGSSTHYSDKFPPSCAQPNRVKASPQAQKSFVDAVNSQSTTPSFPKVIQHSYLAGAPSAKFVTKTESQGLPKIQFSVAEIERLSEHFRFAIVGKFSHGFPPYRNMHRLLSTLKLQGPFTVTMITNRHVLINLKNEADFTKLWIQRLWHIDGFLMRTFKFTPSFQPQHESSVAPVWICFPTLPAHLFHKDVLHAIASFVGTPLKLDESTLFQSRLTAARVCVEVHLTNELVEKIVIGIGDEEGPPTAKRQGASCTESKEKVDKNVENVIFEIGESSNTNARNQQVESNVDAIGIQSNNLFQVLNQMENEDDGAGTNQVTLELNLQEPTNTRHVPVAEHPVEPPLIAELLDKDWDAEKKQQTAPHFTDIEAAEEMNKGSEQDTCPSMAPNSLLENSLMTARTNKNFLWGETSRQKCLDDLSPKKHIAPLESEGEEELTPVSNRFQSLEDMEMDNILQLTESTEKNASPDKNYGARGSNGEAQVHRTCENTTPTDLPSPKDGVTH
ncbi:UNVERIFIED_CONTAM: hypothetical protein Sradi_5262700 [Sesamum radiatum]|uniref:DUF4283 domain-containing protein n=1 Tax=Sesamum radiatum TaxID=300843 RepID=A0AAW2LL47_SESRA